MNTRGKLLLKLAGVSTNPPEHKNVSNEQNTLVFEKPIQGSSVQESSKMNGM